MFFLLKPLWRRIGVIQYITTEPEKVAKKEKKKRKKKKPLIILPDRREQESRDYEDMTFLAIMDFI